MAGASADQDQGLKKLTASEQEIWRDALVSYATGVSKKDLVFDDPLPDITNTLARAGEAKSLTGSGVDPTIASFLERAAPIYRKAWWADHRDANRRWQSAIQNLVDQHGMTILALITKAYELEWPAKGFAVHVSAYSNWAGAYSTRGNLLVLSSLTEGTQGTFGLETIFHEGMHQWDDQILEALTAQATRIKKRLPEDLSHALIFFTAGESVRRVVPQHVPYADKFGVWQRGWGSFKLALEEIWKPYLDGRGTRDEAFLELVKRTAAEPRAQLETLRGWPALVHTTRSGRIIIEMGEYANVVVQLTNPSLTNAMNINATLSSSTAGISLIKRSTARSLC